MKTVKSIVDVTEEEGPGMYDPDGVAEKQDDRLLQTLDLSEVSVDRCAAFRSEPAYVLISI